MSDLDKEELEATRNIGKTTDEEIRQHFEFVKSGINKETKFIDVSILEYFEELLDLYNKEKEKNKILELAKIPYLKGEIMAYKENNDVQRKMLNDAFDRGWIHKDKLREKIKEYDGLKEMDLLAYEEQIKPLKELLEEN